MSFFGKNIKKIRSVRGLSQQAFADLFDLKRGTLGAYEEGRSEPKIETIIKIANYFSISIDDILTHELTVNELLRFKGDLTTFANEVKQDLFPSIPFVADFKKNDYVEFYNKPNFIDELPCIQLPTNADKTLRAFEVSDLEMTNQGKGFYPKDIIIGEKVSVSQIEKLSSGTYVMILTAEKLIFRKLFLVNGKVNLRAAHDTITDEKIEVSDIKELWQICHVFFKRLPELSNTIEQQLALVQLDLEKIKESLK